MVYAHHLKITDDYERLWRIGDEEYAKAHVGKTYDNAELISGGWAIVDSVKAKFHPDTFTII